MNYWRKEHPTLRMREIRVMKKYAEEAYNMRYAELVQAYVKCKFGHTVFSSFPPGFWDDILEDLEDIKEKEDWTL